LHAQPPADAALGGAAMFHYTWGTVFKDSFGRKIWEFDKRTYTNEVIQRKVSRHPAPGRLAIMYDSKVQHWLQ
jgi:hypothetical protein